MTKGASASDHAGRAVADHGQVRLNIDLDRLTIIALGVTFGIVGLNIVLGLLKYFEHSSFVMDVLAYFDVGNELTFPAWFTTIVLALLSLLIWPFRTLWRMMRRKKTAKPRRKPVVGKKKRPAARKKKKKR